MTTTATPGARHQPVRAAAAATVFALVVTGCSGASNSATSTTQTTAASAAAPGSGLKEIDQGALQVLVDTTIKDQLIPGAVVVLQTPQGNFTAASGTTERGVLSAPDADTHFRIASNTKTMTAAVILQLAQEGKLSLDDPVSKYVPGVPGGDNITITELLKMRTGLYNYTNPPLSRRIDWQLS